jgi:hypothetical protein
LPIGSICMPSEKPVLVLAWKVNHACEHPWQVAAKYQGSLGSSYATVDLRAEGSALVAALEGPSGRQPDTLLLLLDASKSLDPDDPQGSSGALTFSWGCTRQDFPALCFEGSYQVGW